MKENNEPKQDDELLEDLTLPEKLTLKRKGTSDFLLFPAEWKRILELHHINPPILEAKLQKSGRQLILYATILKDNDEVK